MNKRKTAKVLALLLCLVMVFGILPWQALAAEARTGDGSGLGKGDSIGGTVYHVASRRDYAIAPDISESVIITNNDAGNSQTVANVMEVNTSGGRAKIVAG